MKLENLEIKKVSVHKIFSKSKKNPEAYADECVELVKLGDDGLTTLTKRISSCINHKSKFYELHLFDKEKDSVFELQKKIWNSDDENFLKISQEIADKAAISHKNANIPDGLLMVIESKIDGFETLIVVKAEKSDAFSMSGTDLQLIKDIFLSSDKALYKIGFIFHRDISKLNENGYKFFVYDDAFSPSKEDLAYYFYSGFLGLSTEKNSKLLTNKLHRSLTKFVNTHIDFIDKFTLQKTIDRVFLDKNKKTINAKDFNTYFPETLNELYSKEIESLFPHAFVKDIAITNTIETKRIELSPETTLLLKNAPDGIITGKTSNTEIYEKLKASIDSGNKDYTYAFIPIKSNN